MENFNSNWKQTEMEKSMRTGFFGVDTNEIDAQNEVRNLSLKMQFNADHCLSTISSPCEFADNADCVPIV